ncbi:TPA: hypothetical protein JFP82_001967 [Vibrio cholerae O1]|uniref:Uncharacterized protein n=1 Tax=Vibrio cholerae TaxID=666 RepID=A0ABD7SS34_VIBCL|nr:hypothetical protein [Vibrio cholerae]EGR2118979.1 hypothetical protein [Vibrio cholerae]TXX67357.1 hypothetical protein FXF03_01920 [Vibrio cholerae]GIA98967.1 hypothetical protein VCSRO136_2212 [Vibrio cholerae]HAU9839163.1 hypothetical protein [Vibrio cholerae O1]HBN6882738.1 hypothetical protein [Vibrio cholerae]
MLNNDKSKIENKVSKFNSQSSSRRKKAYMTIIIFCFFGFAWQLYYFGYFESVLPAPGDKPVQVISSTEPARPDTLKSSIDSSQTSSSVSKANYTSPPIVDSNSFNQLQNLYLLTKRVQSGELTSAAEMYGLQRINIQNLREQAKEVKIQSDIAQYQLERTRAFTESAKISDPKKITLNQTGNIPSEIPKNGNNHDAVNTATIGIPDSQLSAVNQNTPLNSLPNISGVNSSQPVDIKVAMILEKTSSSPYSTLLYINSEPKRNVIEGQVVANVLKVKKIDIKLGCVTFEDITTSKPIISCVN